MGVSGYGVSVSAQATLDAGFDGHGLLGEKCGSMNEGIK